jgi:hypothetical protein
MRHLLIKQQYAIIRAKGSHNCALIRSSFFTAGKTLHLFPNQLFFC